MSRQRDWQRKQVAAGNCCQCGKPRSGDKNLCAVCKVKCNESAKLYVRRKKGYKPWVPGGVGRPPKGVKKDA